MSLSQEALDAIRTAVAEATEAKPTSTAAELAVAAAGAAVAVGRPADQAADINAISHTIPNFWSEDIEGFEAACLNKNITPDGMKYSKLLSILTPAACTRMVGHLLEPGTAGASYDTLKKKLKAAYTKTTTQRCAELLSIVSLGDRDLEHLLSYMKGLLRTASCFVISG